LIKLFSLNSSKSIKPINEASVSRLAFIDILRGLAILLVISTHLKGIFPGVCAPVNALLSFGRAGVQLFFIASAYTLCVSWESRKSEGRLETACFFVRRYFRIAPLYYFGILLYLSRAVLLSYQANHPFLWPDQYNPASVLANVLLLHGFYPPGYNNVVPGGWSIGTEFAFYLLFPFLFTFMKKRSENPLKIGAVVIVYFALVLLVHAGASAWFHFHMKLGDYWFHSIFNQLTVFLIGITGMIFHARYLKRFPPICDVALILTGLIGSFAIWNLEQSLFMSCLPFLLGMTFIFLLFFISRYEILWMPLIASIGKVSYSMYVWHFLVISICASAIPDALLKCREFALLPFFVVVTTATYLICRLSECFIEQPGIRCGKRIVNYLRSKYSDTVA